MQGVANFRDVGKSVNDFLGERRLREGLLFRSARLDDASPEDKDFLINEIGLKSILDLRSNTERADQAKSTALAAHPPAPRKAYERLLMGQLSWLSFIWIIILFIFRQRHRAVALVVREAMVPRGLVGTQLDTMEHCGADVAKAVRVFTQPANLPVIAHCSLGKDRTGLVIALVLMLLGVPKRAIEYDYARTDVDLEPKRAQIIEEISYTGLPPSWAYTAKDLIERVAKLVQEKFGGIDAYADFIGITAEERAVLRETLLY
ncbi:unnamed protein product [Parascedosporium putredinis]|uniref:Tyrosine specific protein phosphatases domain-containing protein n=1 Tax=Parascedosporium putredinis TaxID=1442378 RepID=A0A9P1GUE3_9PEZI|nr:unnamed protein product [Parascedosporium putredinis]CAI7987528.1 unnamed protein product [Parascedosporium putredinis]